MPLQELDKLPIEPVYSQTVPNEPISIDTIDIDLSVGDSTLSVRADVTMRFTPKERLCIVVPPTAIPFSVGHKIFKGTGFDGTIKLADRGVSLNVSCLESSSKGGLTFVPKASMVLATARADGIVEATFHLLNLPDFHGPEDFVLVANSGAHPEHRLCGRVILCADGWRVTIAASGRTQEACKALDDDGGFIITHVGKIERDNAEPFTSEQLTQCLRSIHVFLSFALGNWTGIAFPIGVDAHGKRIYEQWGTPMMTSGPWTGSASWFDPRHSAILAEVFPGFSSRWNNDTWSSPFWKAIYWYLNANTSAQGIGVDARLILAQAALEQLAWTYCVHHRKMVSENAFGRRGLATVDRLRLLLSSLEIPAALPSGAMKALHGRRGKKWVDGPDAITSIRNELVHPHEGPDPLEGSYFEAWELALWYLDLVLLRLCHHDGLYANRVVPQRIVGQVEPVPWAPPATERIRSP